MQRRTLLEAMFSVGALASVSRAAGYINSLTPLQQRVRAQLDLAVDDGLTAGAVMLVVQSEKVLAFESSGYSDLTTRQPIRSDAIFDIRSISKPVTVLGVLFLVEDGALTLDDPVARFLPEFSHLTVKGQTQPTNVPITIRQLMTHTSGVADQRPPELENITRTFDHTLTEDVSLVARQPLDFVPGTQWAYSSSGIAVLGRVIEVLSRQPFETFMQQRLFVPLDMRDSTFFTDRAKANRIPTMYNLENGRLVKDKMDVTRPGQRYSAPDFGLFSTAEDLSHLAQMMLNRGGWKGQRILSSRLLDEMTRPQWQTSVPKYHSGLGWAIHTGDEKAEMSYAVTDGSYGANGASGCILWIDPSIQLLRIYLTHYFLGDFREANPVMNAAFPG